MENFFMRFQIRFVFVVAICPSFDKIKCGLSVLTAIQAILRNRKLNPVVTIYFYPHFIINEKIKGAKENSEHQKIVQGRQKLNRAPKTVNIQNLPVARICAFSWTAINLFNYWIIYESTCGASPRESIKESSGKVIDSIYVSSCERPRLVSLANYSNLWTSETITCSWRGFYRLPDRISSERACHRNANKWSEKYCRPLSRRDFSRSPLQV